MQCVKNVKKSNFIIFRPRQNRQTLDLAFNISNYQIDRVKEATFLGVILDGFNMEITYT